MFRTLAVTRRAASARLAPAALTLAALTPAALAPFALALAAITALAAPVHADEGMWTFDNLPVKQIQERYGFTPTREWLDHVQKACVNFGRASGSFVSPDGLVLTNHHVGLGQLQKVSSEKADYVRDGFFACTRAEEMRCPDLEIQVLMSTEDVTARVKAGIDPAAPEKARNAQRKAAIARIEKECTGRTRQKCRVVELYHGGEYWLYVYQKYTDVRLVMAPEEQAAFFGGDPDNFSYPRHDLDMTFFRVYENGQPVHSPAYFRWNAAGPKEGELVFVAGHPGTTSRMSTVSQLEYRRDCDLPVTLRIRAQQLEALREYSAQGPEQARRATDVIFGLENTLKRLAGFRAALADGRLLQVKRGAEDSLRARVAAEPALAAAAGAAWDRIAAAQKEMSRRNLEYLVRTRAVRGRLLTVAEQIVRQATEATRPEEQRLEEFRESHLDALRYQLFSPAPIYPDLEENQLRTGLELCSKELGPGNAFVQAALGGRSAGEVAHELVSGTRLADVAFRRQLVQGGSEAVERCDDPLIRWVLKLEPLYRELRGWYEDNVESVESLEGGQIAQARFAVHGHAAYPDATGALRLSFGRVAGYEQLTTRVPWKTTFLGLYDRSASFDNRPPFDLPARLTAARDRIRLDTPLDFVTTNDIIGGNSGSPVIDRDAGYVGLVFDGNVQAFAWDYAFDETQGRTVAVHSAAILEALRGIYGMDGLADELAGKR